MGARAGGGEREADRQTEREGERTEGAVRVEILEQKTQEQMCERRGQRRKGETGRTKTKKAKTEVKKAHPNSSRVKLQHKLGGPWEEEVEASPGRISFRFTQSKSFQNRKTFFRIVS